MLSERPEQDENEGATDNEDFNNDASLFTTASAGSASDWDIYGNITIGPGAEDDELATHLDSENNQNLCLREFENSNTENAGGVEKLPVLLDRDGHEDATNPYPTPKPTTPKSRSVIKLFLSPSA